MRSPKYLTPAFEQEFRIRLQDRVMVGCDLPRSVTSAWSMTGSIEGCSDEILERSSSAMPNGTSESRVEGGTLKVRR